MKIHHLWPFAFGVLVVVSMNSCTKTVVQTQIQTKVDSLTVVDSIHDTVGRGWVRFVSIFPQNVVSQIEILRADSTTVLTFANNTCAGSYFPVAPDLSTTLYASIPILGGLQLLPIPALHSTMNTYALFLVIDSNILTERLDSSLYPVRSVDSEKFNPPPPGYCYIRLINGIADAAGPFFLDTSTVGHSVFVSNLQPQSVPAFQFSYYALIPAGQRAIFLRIDDPSNPKTVVPLQTLYRFQEGTYYTVLATGSLAGQAFITVDPE